MGMESVEDRSDEDVEGHRAMARRKFTRKNPIFSSPFEAFSKCLFESGMPKMDVERERLTLDCARMNHKQQILDEHRLEPALE